MDNTITITRAPAAASSSAAAGSPYNYLVNGGFEQWPFGAGAFTADGAYPTVRWLMDEIGTDTLSVTREGTVKSPNSLYSLAAVFVLGNGAGATQIYQQLSINANETNHGLLGKAISASIEVDLAAGVASAVRAFIATDGTGGTTTYSSYHGNNTTLETLSVENITVPTDATYVRVGLAFAASCTAYMDNAMLVIGTTAVTFAYLTPEEDLTRCQRYARQYDIAAAETGPFASGFAFDTTNAILTSPLAPTMAVSPTLTVTAGDWQANTYAAAVTLSGLAIIHGRADRITLQLTVAAGLTQFRPYAMSALAGATRTLLLTANP